MTLDKNTSMTFNEASDSASVFHPTTNVFENIPQKWLFMLLFEYFSSFENASFENASACASIIFDFIFWTLQLYNQQVLQYLM
jgi:hypothetical protein